MRYSISLKLAYQHQPSSLFLHAHICHLPELNTGLLQCAVSKTTHSLTLFRDISDPKKVVFSCSINSTVNNIARAFFCFLFWNASTQLPGRGICLQMVRGLCSYCLYMGTFQLCALILFAAGQWDIGSHLHNGHRHSGIMDCITTTDVTAAYDFPFSFFLFS